MNKDVKQMIRDLRSNGYTTTIDGRSHYRVVAPDGTLVRDDRGMPVTVPFSPGRSAIGNTRRRLVAMGLIRTR